MATMEEVINQAISDFDDIETAIEEMGVDVPAGTDTKEYANYIRKIAGVGNVDQEYNPESENAQSGKAVAGALNTLPVKYVESLDKENYLNLYDLESGTYILYGYFLVYPNATKRFTFSKKMLVSVSHGSVSTCVQVFYPPYNTIQYLNIYPPDEEAGTDYTFERKDAELYYMESTENKVTSLDTTATDEQYPSAKAVYDKVKDTSNALKANASGEVIRVDDVSPIEHKVRAKVSGKNLLRDNYFKIETQTKGGVTCIANSDGSYTLSVENTTGAFVTFSSNRSSNIDDEPILPAGIYTSTAGVTVVCRDVASGKEVNRQQTFEVTEPFRIVAWYCYVHYTDSTVGGAFKGLPFTFYPQLEAGDTATEYEPYIDPTTVTVTRCGKNLLNSSKLLEADGWAEVNGVYSGYAARLYDVFNNESGKPLVDNLQADRLYTLTFKGYNEATEEKTSIAFVFVYEDGTKQFCYLQSTAEKAHALTSMSNKRIVALYANYGNNLVAHISDLQLEESDTATEYEAYNGATYTPETDGTCEIVSVSPTMTLLTDKEGAMIEIEYNQDNNAFADNVKSDLKELDKVTAKLIEDMGDIDTALDSIIAIQNALIGGESV